MNFEIMVQARMGSTRFPGKVLEDIFPEEPMLKFLLERLEFCKTKLTVVTSTEAQDDVIEQKCTEWGVNVFRGSETNVLSRFVEASSKDVIIRITADCPLIDPSLVTRAIKAFDVIKPDYLRYSHTQLPRGLADIELIYRPILDNIHRGRYGPLIPHDLEHVTWYIRRNQEKFHTQTLSVAPSLWRPEYNLSVDTPEALDKIRQLIRAVSPNCFVFAEDLIRGLDANPHLRTLKAYDGLDDEKTKGAYV